MFHHWMLGTWVNFMACKLHLSKPVKLSCAWDIASQLYQLPTPWGQAPQSGCSGVSRRTISSSPWEITFMLSHILKDVSYFINVIIVISFKIRWLITSLSSKRKYWNSYSSLKLFLTEPLSILSVFLLTLLLFRVLFLLLRSLLQSLLLIDNLFVSSPSNPLPH